MKQVGEIIDNLIDLQALPDGSIVESYDPSPNLIEVAIRLDRVGWRTSFKRYSVSHDMMQYANWVVVRVGP